MRQQATKNYCGYEIVVKRMKRESEWRTWRMMMMTSRFTINTDGEGKIIACGDLHSPENENENCSVSCEIKCDNFPVNLITKLLIKW
jgi:hypothetical protein